MLIFLCVCSSLLLLFYMFGFFFFAVVRIVFLCLCKRDQHKTSAELITPEFTLESRNYNRFSYQLVEINMQLSKFGHKLD